MIKLTIGERLKLTDINTYHKLLKMCKGTPELKKNIELGCSVEELMRADSYVKVSGKVKQRGWS